MKAESVVSFIESLKQTLKLLIALYIDIAKV